LMSSSYAGQDSSLSLDWQWDTSKPGDVIP
jgi:hypothetical protein